MKIALIYCENETVSEIEPSRMGLYLLNPGLDGQQGSSFWVRALPGFSKLPHHEKDAWVRGLWSQVQTLTKRVAELVVRLGAPPKTLDGSSCRPRRARSPTVRASR